jgi:2-polyprenyl-6-methoxyphenol hydroxylase-like FAD-dependent oxidoreductase
MKRAMAETTVLIAGAGPTGLVLALWLTRFGVNVRIIDKTAEPGTTSRALGVAARTLELYRQAGIDGAVVDGGVKVPAMNLWVGGRRAAKLPLQRMGEGMTPFPFVLMYPQDVHERFLIAQLAALGVRVERNTELLRFEQDAAGVRATLRPEGGAEEECHASYLAGCDGAHSTVREALGIGFAGGTYAEIFYVADVDAAGPAANGEMHLDLEEADFLAVFPLKGTGRLRLIGSILRSSKPHEELTFDDVGKRVIDNLQFVINKVNWFSTYHVHHRVADSFRKGRAFLLGDAAHIHSPVGAQGMNTGIGDAVNLAWKIAAVLQGSGESLLETYEQERIGFARRLVATTDRAFTVVTAHGAVARFVRKRLFPIVARTFFRLPAFRRFLFRTVSQIAIRYPDSALSEGRAASISGGDRLPWVGLDRQQDGYADNFAPLISLSWQVHVYGKAASRLAGVCADLALPLINSAWRPDMKRAGFTEGTLYLIRPDGYIAFVDARTDPEALKSYWMSRALANFATSSTSVNGSIGFDR